MSKSGKVEKEKEKEHEGSPLVADVAKSWSFEQSLKRLEELVRRLEQGNVPLEQSLTDYSEAVELLRVCQGKLESAQSRVELLSGFDADGVPISRPIASDGEMTLDEKRGARSSRRSATGSQVPAPKHTGSKQTGSKAPDRNQTDMDESGQLF